MTSGRRAEWICYVLGTLPGAALALIAAAGLLPERAAVGLFALSFIGLNLMHNAATWSRAYLDADGLASAPIERIVIPALLVTSALVAEALGGAALLLGAQYYLSIHHAAMQNYGILRHTQRRAGRALGARLDQAACLLLPIGALLYRASAVTDRYNEATLASPPLWLATAVLVAGAAALLAFVVREAIQRARGQGAPLVGVVFAAVTTLLWSWLILSLSHPALPLYALASGHYVQYLYFVACMERRPASAAPGWLLRLLVAGGAIVLVITAGAAAARAIASAAGARPPGSLAIPPWAAAMIGVNLAHYWLDSRIWRRRASRGAAAEGAAGAT
jgi:hypothetical protein